MKVSPRVFLGISLGLHALAGAVVYRHATHAVPASVDTPKEGRPPEALFKGETFEVPIDVPAGEGGGAGAGASPSASASAGARARAGVGERASAGAGARARAGESAGPGAVFGATGDRASIDLATAFTRGFPQAASADPAWIRAPFGSAGEATVILQIDATGSLVDSRIEGNPSPELRAGLERTLALIHARAFTAKGATTRLRVSARVSPDEVHDGLHGEVFAIGGSFAAAEGQAFFALAIGRRVDLRVTE